MSDEQPAPDFATKDDLRDVHSRLDLLERSIERAFGRAESFVVDTAAPAVVHAAEVVAGDVAAAGAALASKLCPKHPDADQSPNGCTAPGCTFPN